LDTEKWSLKAKNGEKKKNSYQKVQNVTLCFPKKYGDFLLQNNDLIFLYYVERRV